ncbi:MAG: VCBS repeat-containing protein [Candidatus Hydrogenedentota bacterium]
MANGLPIGWKLYGGLDEKRVLSLVDAPEEGEKALQIADGHPSEELGVVQTVPIEPNTPYVAGVSVKAVEDAGPAGAYIQLRFQPSNEYVQRPLIPGLNGQYQRIEVGKIAPENAREAVLYLYTHRDPTPQVIVDNVSLAAVETLPGNLALSNTAEVPEIEALKPLYLETTLVADGKAMAAIVAPGDYREQATAVQAAIKEKTRVELPIIPDDGVGLPFERNIIAIGNMARNQFIAQLYEHYYTLLDLRYPGPGGYVVRTLHNPLGDGRNVVFLGGSDAAGIEKAVAAFTKRLSGMPRGAMLTLPHLMEIELGTDIEIPTDLREFRTWEASAGYRSVGYFGWNSISKRMAMYYMTGDPFHAREVIRLAFPDAQAKAEIAEIDGERIENKDAPLSGPYHYNAHLMVLFWDLIEESPVFTDDERLRVTRAFAHQLDHPGIRSAYRGPYAPTPAHVGSRHGQWTAISLYCLGRYFAKDYGDPIWPVCEQNGRNHFASLHKHAWVSGENDNLFWYDTAIAPIFTYMLLSGDRVPMENGVAAQLLRGLEILASGKDNDWALRCASLGFLHKAAYFTEDGRWLTYRDRTGVDTSAFRLGQSYWPEEDLKPAPPDDTVGAWRINPMPEPMWKWRNNGFPLEESFLFMSYRNRTDDSGDFILLDGFNGASRNPYHTFAILALRQDGATLLEGYRNQLRTRADGLTENTIAMDAALKHYQVLGETVVAIGEVPDMPYTAWRRALIHREGRYAVVIDELTPRIDTENLEVQLLWETDSGNWTVAPEHPNQMRLNRFVEGSAPRIPVVCTASDVEILRDGSIATMQWFGPARPSEKQYFFSLVTGLPAETASKVACMRLADNAAILLAPEPTLVAAGAYEGIEAELSVLSEEHFYGKAVTQLAIPGQTPFFKSEQPMDLDWDLEGGEITLVASETPEDEPNARPAPLPEQTALALHAWVERLVEQARGRTREEVTETAKQLQETLDSLPVTTTKLGESAIVDIVAVPESEGLRLYAAGGESIHALNLGGEKLACFQTDGPIRMLHWWPEPQLLLAGCTDEKVIAFDRDGNRRWVFVSEMDPAVYRAAKTYWFKSAPGHEGIHGLYSGPFIDDKPMAFVGSACTLEIVDENGQLVRRMPQFWGKVSVMKLIPGPEGSHTLLAARRYNGTNTLGIINSVSLDPDRRGFYSVPEGHTHVPGWSAMNREHIFFEDFDGDGEKEVMTEINGVWNRVTVWRADGTAEYDASFGPGKSIPYINMRDIDTGDLTGDGLPDIVVATVDRLVVALTGRCEKLWSRRLPFVPTVLACIIPTGGQFPWIVIGGESGNVLVLDAEGTPIRQAALPDIPTKIVALPEEHTVVFGAEDGHVATCAMIFKQD